MKDTPVYHFWQWLRQILKSPKEEAETGSFQLVAFQWWRRKQWKKRQTSQLYQKLCGASKSRWSNCWENPDVLLPNRLLHSSFCAPSSQNTVAGPVSPQTAPVPGNTYIPQAPLLLLEDRWILQTRRLFVLLFGILVGLHRWSQYYWLVKCQTSTPSSWKQASGQLPFWFFFQYRFGAIDSLKMRKPISQLSNSISSSASSFWLVKDDGETP